MNPLLGGTVHSKTIDGWTVTWESNGDYRHWCEQRINPVTIPILVVLFNPGALKGDGEFLNRDTTLRNLRRAFFGTNHHPFVINLFDRATRNADELFTIWDQRDSPELIFERLRGTCFSGLIFGYGKKESNKLYGATISERIEYVRNLFSGLPIVESPKEMDGSPMHPYRWEIERVIQTVNSTILKIDSCGGKSNLPAPRK